MPATLDDRLVVAVASSALFDLADSDHVFRNEGEEPYRAYQRENELAPLAPGVAFPFIRRLLGITDEAENRVVEVVLLSRNDPDTGLRVLNSIEHHRLAISRAAFVKGRNPHAYMSAFNASLFLSANAEDVRHAVEQGLPAGQVLPTQFTDNTDDHELRLAFDFDGIIADDSSETIYKRDGLSTFQSNEREHALEPLLAGPLQRFFTEVAGLQKRERARQERDRSYRPRLRVAIVTARDAPAHKRVITTLREWGIQVDEAFFLGGLDKTPILRAFKPHIFFDDQLAHLDGASKHTPSVHVPFGIANVPA